MAGNKPSSSTTPQWKYDVLVSFKPDEKTKDFITGLFKWLNQVGINYFKDDEGEIFRQKDNAKRLEKIRSWSSAIALVVFSENHLDSIACLGDLVRAGAGVVIPIYSATDSEYKDWRSSLEAQKISGYEWNRLTAACVPAKGTSKPIDIIAERLVKEIHSLYRVKVFGPFGGEGEEPWDFTYEFNKIKGIAVEYGPFIKSITFEAQKAGGEYTYQVELAEGEYISSFAGYFENAGVKKIKSLTFRTNKRTLGPIGREEGEYFSVPSKAGKVTKIFGRSNKGFLESIGADVELQYASEEFDPVQSVELFAQNSDYWGNSNRYNNIGKITLEFDSSRKRYIQSIELRDVEEDGELKKYFSSPVQQVKSYTIKSEGPDRYLISMSKSIGPLGGGNTWDDGKFDGVRKIYLPKNRDIPWIIFVYDNRGEEVREVTHPKGVSPDSEEGEIILDYPREYLTSISGYKQEDGSISSLTFHSNKTKYDRGKEKSGQYFCSLTTGSRIIGFYGTWGKTLDSIGVHVEPIPHMRPFEMVRPSFSRGFSGTYWDDGVHSNVIAYRVTDVMDRYDRKTTKYVRDDKKGSLKIESITFKYDNNGVEFIGRRRGGGEEDAGKWVPVNFPEQRLTWITGWMREEDGQTIIHDLKIVAASDPTYAKRADPRWSHQDQIARFVGSTYFSIPGQNDPDRRIVGFFGTAGEEHLSSIGARLEPY